MGTAGTSRCSWRVLLTLALITVVVVEECSGEAVETTHHYHRRNRHHPHHRHHRHRHHHRKIPIPVGNLEYEDAWSSPNTRDKRQGWTEEWESGPWGEWSVPSPCSRTCGGGVSFKTRTCQGTSSQQCVGKTKKYESCNIEPCPEGSPDFRTEQCQRYNSVPFEGKYYSWVPHYKAPRKCELNCQPEGERFYYRHALKVVDGTPCDNEGFDVCVDGQCLPVGCDLILGSSAREDKCRVCGGDGSTCKTITGDFMQETLTVGYNDIVLIPAGATNIYVEELTATNNYLAVRNTTGHFYLNGNWRIDFPRARKFAGTTFHYERKNNGGVGIFAPEILRALGPTTEPLFIVLLYQETNQGVAYEYSVPEGVTQAEAETYDWIYGTFGECSEECGGGLMVRNVTCARTSDFEPVSDYLCDPRQRPETNMTCNEQPCQAGWEVGDWTPCTSSCGTQGWQFRHVYCGQKFTEGRLSVVNESVCTESLGAAPQSVRECNQGAMCASWHVEDWTPCNKLCGVGRQYRKVKCHVMRDDEVEVLDDSACSEEKPESEKPCEQIPCGGVDWITSDWSGCGVTCDQAQESRSTLCVSQKGVVVSEEYCSVSRKPELTRNCSEIVPCEYKWYASEWSECSAECGIGVMSREVFCGKQSNKKVMVVEETNCDADKRFNDTKECNSTSSCKAKWYAGPWSQCDKQCGGGTKNRKIFCYIGDKLAKLQCDVNSILYSIDTCNNNPCGDDEVLGSDLEDEYCEEEEESEEKDKKDKKEKEEKEDEDDMSVQEEAESSSVTMSDEASGEGSGFGESGFGFGSGLSGLFGSGLGSGIGIDAGSGEMTDMDTDKKPPSKKKDAKKAKKKCKPRPKPKSCEETEFGCCQDNETPAEGPFQKGCDTIETCKDSKFGCCPDGLTPAEGPKKKGCPGLSVCDNSLYGCCKDGVTEASGPNEEGCEELIAFDCENTEFGCCPDGVSPASGKNFEGCTEFECDGSGPCDSCNETVYGCCPDGVSAAQGKDFEGCPDPDKTTAEIDDELSTLPYLTSTTTTTELPPDCLTSSYGCCPDQYTAAHGPNGEGCCLSSPFGCCPDHITEAQGPNLQGCGCEYSAFGCCPDNTTVARGPNNAGCGCQYTEFGCCPDNHTPAAGEDYSGCPCNTYRYGCCPDGVSIAKGPGTEGCGCQYEKYGCCEDGRTPAKGPQQEGCGCESSEFGCCPDGVTPAAGKFFDGCEEEAPVVPGEVCGLEKDRGSCTNFTVRWFFDMEYGGCTRFWYGGCEGNRNKFATQEECKAACVDPEGMESCSLPRVVGPCTGSVPSWYHDSETGTCKSFIYGGCLGNNNRYSSREACEERCVIPEKTDACLLEVTPGPCRGNYSRWFYDQTVGSCKQFSYGGCKGNDNNFLTENECMQRCIRGRSKDLCTLPKASGLCEETLPRWYYDYSEARCMPFYYTGCDGNANRYMTRGECEATCPGDKAEVDEDVCYLPSSPGDCDEYVQRWYFDGVEGQCKSFVYGGCGGNNNNFATFEDCENYCGNRKKIPTEEEFHTEFCFLEQSQGTCSDFQAYWQYDSKDGVCKQFLYSGCGGNKNRFKTRQECENKCGDAQDICQLPLVVGPCSGSFRQFYFDSSANQCFEFDYGGCQGNKNRFDSLRLCQQRCQTTQATTPHYTVPEEEPTSELPEICKLPAEIGPCRGAIPSWYYDVQEDRCIAFSYGGCSGNANRFQSVELCERQCGKHRDQDVCNIPASPGPCSESIRKWYYDPYVRLCKSFAYGGCEGNGNRFSTSQECEAECVYHDTLLPNGNSSQEAQTMICELNANPGPCSEGFKRWHFNKEHGTCVMFLYGGCGGNQNRFKTFNACTEFCALAIEKYRRHETSTPAPVFPTVYGPSGYTQPDVTDRCQESLINCQLLQCPYGVQRRVDNDGCDRCSCYDPCHEIQCPDETECSIDLVPATDGTSENTYKGVCRQVNKPGRCPQNNGQTYQCDNECQNDANCDGALKCCYNGCGYSCVSPIREEEEAGHVSPPVGTPTVPEYGEPPRITKFDEDVSVEENDVVSITCMAQGNPKPSIIWYRGSYTINTETLSSRFRILPEGSLQVVNVERSDNGKYTCEANNGIGSPARRTAQLTVLVPLRAVIRLNATEFLPHSTIRIPCEVRGVPVPQTTWFKGNNQITASNKYAIEEDSTLVITDAEVGDSGQYKCHVQNEYGIADSTTVITIKGIYVHPTCTDNPFFANCKLIVRAKYCTNKYYARFCCRSCTLDGQLPSQGAHLTYSKKRK